MIQNDLFSGLGEKNEAFYERDNKSNTLEEVVDNPDKPQVLRYVN
jgi:hypothetical protein